MAYLKCALNATVSTTCVMQQPLEKSVKAFPGTHGGAVDPFRPSAASLLTPLTMNLVMATFPSPVLQHGHQQTWSQLDDTARILPKGQRNKHWNHTFRNPGFHQDILFFSFFERPLVVFHFLTTLYTVHKHTIGCSRRVLRVTAIPYPQPLRGDGSIIITHHYYCMLERGERLLAKIGIQLAIASGARGICFLCKRLLPAFVRSYDCTSTIDTMILLLYSLLLYCLYMLCYKVTKLLCTSRWSTMSVVCTSFLW